MERYSDESFDFRLKPLPSLIEMTEVSVFVHDYGYSLERAVLVSRIMLDNRGNA